MRDHLNYEILGSTVDDAAGEAFDKTARLLGLPYPGGPKLSAAAQARVVNQTLSIQLPRPMLGSTYHSPLTTHHLDFSFSGLKTAVRYAIDRGDIHLPDDLDAAARAIEDAIVDVLIAKLGRAIIQTKPASVTIVGGVSANRELRRRLFDDLLSSQHPQLTGLLAAQQFTTDNAAMIGSAAIFRLARNEGILTDPFDLVTSASLRLS
jgi:N6-L-threonylcarbamoyladenine synthase